MTARELIELLLEENLDKEVLIPNGDEYLTPNGDEYEDIKTVRSLVKYIYLDGDK